MTPQLSLNANKHINTVLRESVKSPHASLTKAHECHSSSVFFDCKVCDEKGIPQSQFGMHLYKHSRNKNDWVGVPEKCGRDFTNRGFKAFCIHYPACTDNGLNATKFRFEFKKFDFANFYTFADHVCNNPKRLNQDGFHIKISD